MHQTTVRFGADLWEALERECELLGLSVAQYVREAALARLVYAAGRRGDEAFEAALGAAAEGAPAAGDIGAPEEAAAPERSTAAFERARIEGAHSSALWAQGRQARRRGEELREQVLQSRRERERRSARPG
jgi:hypothetical protein